MDDWRTPSISSFIVIIFEDFIIIIFEDFLRWSLIDPIEEKYLSMSSIKDKNT